MKLAIVGGGGVRVPLLVNGLIRRGLPFDRVDLFDIDAERARVMAGLIRVRLPDIDVTTHTTLDACVRAAGFVVTSIRVGGLAARQHDERTALAHNLVAQETVGPGGFAMAIRTVPVLAACARTIADVAPDAWVVNFSNPVGIVTQAMREAAPLRVVGICDTPTELFAEAAHALGVPAAECQFDYVGLNHLGWLREVTRDGQPLLPTAWADKTLLARMYSRPLFPPSYLARLRLLPTEYVFYYEFPDRAVSHIKAAGTTRGEVVKRLTDDLFATLAARPSDPVGVYERYLAARSASYMQIESGQPSPNPPAPWAELTGYDRIAFEVIHAIVHDTGAVIPVNIPNDGSIPELADDDIIEAPCVIGRGGPRPLRAGPLPSQIRELVLRVRRYERRTIEAARDGSRDARAEALALNPLVPSRELAAQLVDELAG